MDERTKRIKAVVQSYIGAIPQDKQVDNWSKLREKMVAELTQIIDEEAIIYEERYEQSIEVLKSVLLESDIPTEFDGTIYSLLKDYNELPKDYKPYWNE